MSDGVADTRAVVPAGRRRWEEGQVFAMRYYRQDRGADRITSRPGRARAADQLRTGSELWTSTSKLDSDDAQR